MDPHSRALKKSTNHGNEVLSQNTTHLIQRPCYQWGCPCKDPAGNRTTRRPPDHRKETQTAVVMVMSPVHLVWPKPSCKARWKAEEDRTDRGRGGNILSGNGQAWSSLSPRGQWRTRKNGGNWLWNHLWCPSDTHVKGLMRWDGMRDVVFVTGGVSGVSIQAVAVQTFQSVACFMYLEVLVRCRMKQLLMAL